MYCNLPTITGPTAHSQNLDYLQYLDKFNTFFYIPETSKVNNKAYGQYLTALWEYLSNFFHRIQPLVSLREEYLNDWQQDFQDKWNKGQLMGWKAPRKIMTSSAVAAAAAPTPLRLGIFNSAEELEALGLDRLKEGLEALGLKCGGSLSERAQRLWSVRGKKAEDIPSSLKAKKSLQTNGGTTNGSASASTSSAFVSLGSGDDGRRQVRLHLISLLSLLLPASLSLWYQLALLEYNIQTLCSLMSEIVTATRRHAEKQQTRTFEEKQLLIEEEEYGNLPDVEVIEEEEDDGPLYNPLNLPLGWDGKPIPYWLYKLHGLGTEFKCEICGNQSYWGRRAFDRHFQEWRHAHGMRCLGVPNTKHFHDITLIEDALSLYAKIKDSLKKEQFYSEVDEEFEDTEGNVLNRRTYEDLARQGLL
jgi:splicing factor 3A subunit 3